MTRRAPRQWRARGVLLMALTALVAPVSVAEDIRKVDPRPAWPAGMPSGGELEAAGAVIGKVQVVAGDVFDTSVPGESSWVYRTANKLHINTRRQRIRDQLLFAPGQPYVHRVVQETERILRANDYLYDAMIRPVAWDGHTVDLEVRTRDTWTLNPGINFSRQGGENSTGIELEEKNLLGNGQELSFGWQNDVDRESLTFDFSDPHFHSTWTRLGLTYRDADDGDTKAFRLERPFYALDTRRATGTLLFDSIHIEPRYAEGERVGEFEQDEQYYELYRGWSPGWADGWVTRWRAGATYERHRFESVPDEPLARTAARAAHAGVPVDRR